MDISAAAAVNDTHGCHFILLLLWMLQPHNSTFFCRRVIFYRSWRWGYAAVYTNVSLLSSQNTATNVLASAFVPS